MIALSEKEAAKLFPQYAARNLREPRGPKYHNRRVYVFEDGFVAEGEKPSGHGQVKERFDSVKEYNRWSELKLLERAGRISELKRQVSLVLQPGFSDGEKSIKPITYVADHMYIENGVVIVEDVKGQDKRTGKFLTTKEFDLKWKLLKNRYPDFAFRLY